jgi:hypothetical protein
MMEPRAELAHQLRISLLEVIAPTSQCSCCFTRVDIEDLEIDHIDGCTWRKRAVSAWRRAELYWEEYDRGVRLRPLCKSCNSSDGNRLRGRARYA